MKQTTKTLFAIGGALLITGGAVVNFLQARKPLTPREKLTLANLEAMAILEPEDKDLDIWNPSELPLMWCGNTIFYQYCVGYCPSCKTSIRSVSDYGPFGGFAGGKCPSCKANL